MLNQYYLTLRLVRLKRSEEWSSKDDGILFLLPKGGIGKYTAGSVRERVAEGDVLVLGADSGTTGRLQATEMAELVFWCFSLRLEHLFPLFDGSEIPLLHKVTAGLEGAKLFPATSPVAIQCHRLIEDVPPQFNLDHRSQLLRVAAAVLAEELKSTRSNRPDLMRVEEHMVEVFEKLSAEELLNFSVSELAVKFGFSRRHLNRLFHQYFGFSVAALRMEMRLLKAVSLLRDTDAKVINVAEQCGFNHLGLFNTCFKRRFGVTPGQWRKRVETRPEQPSADASNCPLHSKGLCPWTGLPADGIPILPKTATANHKPSGAKALSNMLPTDQAMERSALEVHDSNGQVMHELKMIHVQT